MNVCFFVYLILCLLVVFFYFERYLSGLVRRLNAEPVTKEYSKLHAQNQNVYLQEGAQIKLPDLLPSVETREPTGACQHQDILPL